jgi:hypothetical protein
VRGAGKRKAHAHARMGHAGSAPWTVKNVSTSIEVAAISRGLSEVSVSSFPKLASLPSAFSRFLSCRFRSAISVGSPAYAAVMAAERSPDSPSVEWKIDSSSPGAPIVKHATSTSVCNASRPHEAC